MAYKMAPTASPSKGSILAYRGLVRIWNIKDTIETQCRSQLLEYRFSGSLLRLKAKFKPAGGGLRER
jgi:hypothetical protein